MGEFVENSLEGLLPVFEQLGNVELLSSEEINGFVKKCRNYEYRLQKREKSPRDFDLYGDYLVEVLSLIRSRRGRQNYFHKKDLIEKPILQKIASIYRRCCDRFPGDIDEWKKQIHFLKRNNLRKLLSKAYTRVLQVHGRNVDLRVESALWEFFSNASVDNARAQLQLAIRMSPEEYQFYDALFRVEVHYVEKIMSRREFLRKTAQEVHQKKALDNEDDGEIDDSVFDVDIDDAVLQLRVPEIIINSAMKSVPSDKLGAMLISMKNSLNECSNLRPEAAERLNSALHDKIVALNNEDTQLYHLQEAVAKKEDEFDAYEKALINLPSEKMHRIFLEYIEKRLAAEPNDTLALIRRNELLAKMLEEGWTSGIEMDMVTELVQDVLQEGDKKLLLEKALKKNPKSGVFWAEWLRYIMENTPYEEIMATFDAQLDRAFKAVSPENTFDLYEVSLEFSLQYRPDDVEEVFATGMRIPPPAVASRMKIVRFHYLRTLLKEGKIELKTMEKEIIEEMEHKPNTVDYYLEVAKRMLENKECNHKLVNLAFKFAVVEHGQEEMSSWLEYMRYSMKHKPAEVSKLYQRAIQNLNPSLCDEFMTAWTLLKQESGATSSKVVQVEKRQTSTADSKEDVKNGIIKKKKRRS